MSQAHTRQVGIGIDPEAEVLDFSGPYEVFTTATRVASRRRPEVPRPFEVLLIAERQGVVRARHRFEVRAQHAIDEHPRRDVLIVAGGVVATELDKPRVIDWIRRCAGQCEIVASVCTGAFLPGGAGPLDEKPATTHWEDAGDLAACHAAAHARAVQHAVGRRGRGRDLGRHLGRLRHERLRRAERLAGHSRQK